MQAVCHEGIGGCAIGVGNDTDAEPDDGAIVQAGKLEVIVDVGGAEAVCWKGTGGAGHVGGLSNVGALTAAGDAEAIDGAMLVAPATCSTGCDGIENTDDEPGVVKLVLLAAVEDDAGIDGLD